MKRTRPKFKLGQCVICNGEKGTKHKGIVIGRSKDWSVGGYIYIISHDQEFYFAGTDPYDDGDSSTRRIVWAEFALTKAT